MSTIQQNDKYLSEYYIVLMSLV